METNEVVVVSSFGPAGERQYGRKFLKGVIRYWPKEVKLFLYTEVPCVVDDPRIVQYNLFEESSACREFIQRNGSRPEANGRRRLPDQRWKKGETQVGYTFRYDAVKFCRKVFAIADAAAKLGKGKMFWIDADVETFAHVPMSIFDVLLPHGYDLSYLGRKDYHSECGLIGYNLMSPFVREFISKFADLYASDRVFTLSEWHDSWVFDWVRGQIPELKGYSIPSGGSKACPFDKCALGAFARHLKGDRKEQQSVAPVRNSPYASLSPDAQREALAMMAARRRSRYASR